MIFGFMLNCPWRLEKRRFEYWTRYQLGPFYFLRGHGKAYWDAVEREDREDAKAHGD